MIPGWTTATRFSRSISRILSIAVKAIVSPPSMPAAPPDRPVPAPRGTIGTPSSAAIRTSSTTSAVVVGKTTAPRQPGVEVGRLVVAVALAVDRVGQERAGRAGGRRSPRRAGRPGWACRRSRRAASMPWIVGRHGRSLRGLAEPGRRRGRMTDVRAVGLTACARRLPLLLAPAVVAVTAAGPVAPSPVAGTARRRRGGDIVPAPSTDRASSSTRPTTPTSGSSWGTRKVSVDSTATIRNTSGAPIDRVELNTIAARLGAIRLDVGDRRRASRSRRRVSDQTIVVPLGGDPAGRRHDADPGPLSTPPCGAA